ncbi:hypothetical protein [Amycolatopsis sp. NPDC058986]|uniref:hypothetical protein n=1 Tax=unclassified Amycolatopsis TaxID=2618356 RepID=UPI003672C024
MSMSRDQAMAALRTWAAPGARARLIAAAWRAGETNIAALAAAARISRPTVYADLKSQDIVISARKDVRHMNAPTVEQELNRHGKKPQARFQFQGISAQQHAANLLLSFYPAASGHKADQVAYVARELGRTTARYLPEEGQWIDPGHDEAVAAIDPLVLEHFADLDLPDHVRAAMWKACRAIVTEHRHHVLFKAGALPCDTCEGLGWTRDAADGPIPCPAGCDDGIQPPSPPA